MLLAHAALNGHPDVLVGLSEIFTQSQDLPSVLVTVPTTLRTIIELALFKKDFTVLDALLGHLHDIDEADMKLIISKTPNIMVALIRTACLDHTQAYNALASLLFGDVRTFLSPSTLAQIIRLCADHTQYQVLDDMADKVRVHSESNRVWCEKLITQTLQSSPIMLTLLAQAACAGHPKFYNLLPLAKDGIDHAIISFMISDAPNTIIECIDAATSGHYTPFVDILLPYICALSHNHLVDLLEKNPPLLMFIVNASANLNLQLPKQLQVCLKYASLKARLRSIILQQSPTLLNIALAARKGRLGATDLLCGVLDGLSQKDIREIICKTPRTFYILLDAAVKRSVPKQLLDKVLESFKKIPDNKKTCILLAEPKVMQMFFTLEDRSCFDKQMIVQLIKHMSTDQKKSLLGRHDQVFFSVLSLFASLSINPLDDVDVYLRSLSSQKLGHLLAYSSRIFILFFSDGNYWDALSLIKHLTKVLCVSHSAAPDHHQSQLKPLIDNLRVLLTPISLVRSYLLCVCLRVMTSHMHLLKN